MSATTSTPPATAMPFMTRCRDGYDKTHPTVRAVYRYGWWSTFAMLMGYTALPRRIDIACPSCGAVFHSITDRKELEKFRYREPTPGER